MTQQSPVTDRTIGKYLSDLGSSRPAPGGGSVAGLVGALAAGLGQMVVSLTIREATTIPGLAGAHEALETTIERLLAASEADELAYSGYLTASRLPKSTNDEKALRRKAMQVALVNAAEVPLGLATTACNLLNQLRPIVAYGTTHALSDAEIAVSLARESVMAGLANVRINIPLIKDTDVAERLSNQADAIEADACERRSALLTNLEQRRES